MANTRQAKKRILVNARKRLRNMATRSSLKTAFKKAITAVEAKNKPEAETLVSKSIKSIDKAAGKGVIHKNTAARKKSRLMRNLNNLPKETKE